MYGAPEHRLPEDGKRLHLHHGPIDLVIRAAGADDEIARAYQQAIDRFQDVLSVLVDELGANHLVHPEGVVIGVVERFGRQHDTAP